MAYQSNLPPGCTARMIDEQCPDEWRCRNCTELLTDEEIENDEEGELLCETCQAVHRIAQFRKPVPSGIVPEPERFYRVAVNSLDLAEAIEEAA